MCVSYVGKYLNYSVHGKVEIFPQVHHSYILFQDLIPTLYIELVCSVFVLKLIGYDIYVAVLLSYQTWLLYVIEGLLCQSILNGHQSVDSHRALLLIWSVYFKISTA